MPQFAEILLCVIGGVVILEVGALLALLAVFVATRRNKNS